ncbi:MAG: hypothetical protein H6839_10210 [Planctomycetes bacterium]|nr:hypothetical protein [Planctomycetota bacterium]
MSVARLLLFALAFACAHSTIDAADFGDFRPKTAPQRTLFEYDKPPAVQRGGGQSFNDHWPWGGIEISAYSGLYPVFLAASQGIDVGIPVIPWISFVLKAEATAGLLLTGGIFDFGFRFHYDFSDKFAVYGELTGRWAIGELTIAKIFRGFFKEVIDADIGPINGLGVGFAGGVELGGRHLRFFAGIHYSAIFVDTELYVEDHSIGLPTITINHFGFQVGMRLYLG